MPFLLGEKDDYTGAQPCIDLAEHFRAAGVQVDVKVYPGAGHGFDGKDSLTTTTRISTAVSAMDCRYWLESNGSFSVGKKNFGQEDPGLLQELIRTCLRRGATVFTQAAAKAQSSQDFVAFLQRTITTKK